LKVKNTFNSNQKEVREKSFLPGALEYPVGAPLAAPYLSDRASPAPTR
jgi:hypothetical protein